MNPDTNVSLEQSIRDISSRNDGVVLRICMSMTLWCGVVVLLLYVVQQLPFYL